MESFSTVPPLSQRVEERELPTLPQDLGITWRALKREDARKLHQLIEIVEQADDSPFRTSYEETEELFDGDWKNFDTDTVVGINAQDEFVAYGLLHMPPGDETATRVFIDGGVHPQAREVGIGQAVVNWLTARAHNMLREKDTQLPGRIASYLQDNAQYSWALFENAGFEARRFYKALRRDLTKPIEQVNLAPNLVIHAFSEELDESIRAAHNDAFRDHWGSQPMSSEQWTQGRSMFQPAWSFAVVDTSVPPDENGPVVAGYAMVNKYEQDWEIAGYTSGYIGTLGVRREYRGQKIALALLTKVMTTLRDDNIEYAELDVDSENPSGAFGMYTYLGFEVSSSSRMFSLEF